MINNKVLQLLLFSITSTLFVVAQDETLIEGNYNDPSLVGVICTCILLVLVICGVRVVIAASIAGIIGLVELIGIGPALGNIGAIPYSKSVTFVLGLLPIFILIGFKKKIDESEFFFFTLPTQSGYKIFENTYLKTMDEEDIDDYLKRNKS